MRKISSQKFFDGLGRVLDDHVIVLDNKNQILDIQPMSMFDQSDVEHYSGWIVPGFINTHCHMELSHMKGMIPTGTGLIPFIKDIVTRREAVMEVIQDAIKREDQFMWENGIMAVGDIANTTHAIDVKRESKIVYHTFIEAFDLMQSSQTEESFQRAKEVYDQTKGRKTLVPHAPYSCTPEILNAINKINTDNPGIISIHNQETIHENNFFLNKSGELVNFYSEFGLSVDGFLATGENSINYYLSHADRTMSHLFVHNTMTTERDYLLATGMIDNVFWSTCGRANLYIENQLPDYRMFSELNAKMTIGTDSAASNWSLSVWDELCTIKKFNSYLKNEELLTWACHNGAAALGLDENLGSIQIGKSPGLVHLEAQVSIENLISERVQPKRIV